MATIIPFATDQTKSAAFDSAIKAEYMKALKLISRFLFDPILSSMMLRVLGAVLSLMLSRSSKILTSTRYQFVVRLKSTPDSVTSHVLRVVCSPRKLIAANSGSLSESAEINGTDAESHPIGLPKD